MDIAREDWLLVFLVAAVVLPLGHSLVTGDSEVTPETDLEQECVSYADAVEANATVAGISECNCIPPDRVDEATLDTPEKVKNASTAFMITCTLDSGQEIGPFAIWRVDDDYGGDLNQTNATVLDEDQR